MQKIVLFIIFIIAGLSANAQSYTPCYSDTPWDWTDPTDWGIWWSGNDTCVNKCPWAVGETPEFNYIFEQNDLSPENGWVILFKNLGCPGSEVTQAIVIFYNIYESKLRIMGIEQNRAAYSSGIVTMEFGGTTTSALTFSDNMGKANSHYPASDDMAMVQLGSFGPGQWWVADFDNIAFDHTNLSQYSTGYSLVFRIYGVQESLLSLNISADLTTKRVTIKGNKVSKTPKVAENGDKVWDILKDVNKLTTSIKGAKLESWADSLDKVEKQTWEYIGTIHNPDNNTTYIAGQLKTTIEDGTLAKALNGIGKVAGAVSPKLKLLVDVVSTISGMSKKTTSSSPASMPFTPTVTTGLLSGEGTLTSQNDEGNRTIPLPGINTTVWEEQYYTCPLGVFGLEDDPVYRERRWEERKYKVDTLESFSGGFITGRTAAFPVKEKWKSIKIDEDLKIAINSASGLRVDAIQVAIIGKPKLKLINDSTYKAKYDLRYDLEKNDKIGNKDSINLFHEDYDYYDENIVLWADGKYAVNNIWFNKTKSFIKNNTYKLDNNSNENIERGDILFRTQWVNVEDFKNTVFTVPEETDVWLRIAAFLTVIEDEGKDTVRTFPFSAEYMLSPDSALIDSVSQKPFPFSFEQLAGYIEVDSTGLSEYEGSWTYQGLPFDIGQTITTESISGVNVISNDTTVLVLPDTDIEFVANQKIVFNPGFTATGTSNGTFSAYIDTSGTVAPPQASTPITDIVKYYYQGVADTVPHQNCDCFPVSQNKSFTIGQTEEKKDKIKPESEEIEIRVYPNPTNDGLVKIDCANLPEDAKGYITVFDLQGRTVFSSNILENTNNVDISASPAGMYILRVITNEKTFNSKILKQ